MITTQHSLHSSYRELVLEHLFVGEVMRHCWRNGLPRIEILKSQVDNSGYDIVLEAHGVMRHVQLKSSHVGAATAEVGVNIELASKPSGCVIWMYFEPETLAFDRFLWFGGEPGEPLGGLEGYKVGRHTKPNADGMKTERASIRRLPQAAFTKLDTIDGVVTALFGNPSERRLGALGSISSMADLS